MDTIRRCKHCKRGLKPDELYVTGVNSWKCVFCDKSTTEKSHGFMGRGPFCPKCQYEFNVGDQSYPKWRAAVAAGTGNFETECGACKESIVPVWSFGKKPAVEEPVPEKAAVAEAVTASPKESPVGETANGPPIPSNEKVKTGMIRVTSTLHKIDKSIPVREIEVSVFETPPATVSVTLEKAFRDANGYQIGKASVFVSWPCYPEEVHEAMAAVKEFARSEMKEIFERKN